MTVAFSNSSTITAAPNSTPTDWIGTARGLGAAFSERAAEHDRTGTFVADNYRDLRDRRFFSAMIPTELGGGGASYAEICAVIRTLGAHCGSTALSYAMHTHPVATNVFKFRHGDDRAERTLRKLAADELIVAGTGANDWLGSSGEMTPVDGGYRVTAHKRFVSGGPGAHLFATSARCAAPDGDRVLHFTIPFHSEGVSILDTWDALGMRGTGSHEVLLENVFVPESAIVLRRPAGSWHPMWHVVIPTALPLITAAYVGLAEAAANLATAAARGKGVGAAPALGEMLTALTVARIGLADMIGMHDDYRFTPTLDAADAILTRKAIAADAVKQAVETASEIVGGPGFFHGHAMERIVRDVRAMHFHPLPARRQRTFTGRVALGLDPIGDA